MKSKASHNRSALCMIPVIFILTVFLNHYLILLSYHVRILRSSFSFPSNRCQTCQSSGNSIIPPPWKEFIFVWLRVLSSGMALQGAIKVTSPHQGEPKGREGESPTVTNMATERKLLMVVVWAVVFGGVACEWKVFGRLFGVCVRVGFVWLVVLRVILVVTTMFVVGECTVAICEVVLWAVYVGGGVMAVYMWWLWELIFMWGDGCLGVVAG